MAVPAPENRASYLLLWLYFVNSVFIFKYDRHLVKFSACIYIISTSTYLHICLHNILIMAASFYWFVKIPHPTSLNKPVTIPVKNQSQKICEMTTTIPSSHFFWTPHLNSSLILQLKMPWPDSGPPNMFKTIECSFKIIFCLLQLWPNVW